MDTNNVEFSGNGYRVHKNCNNGRLVISDEELGSWSHSKFNGSFNHEVRENLISLG